MSMVPSHTPQRRLTGRARPFVLALQRVALAIAEHWLFLLIAFFALYLGAAFAAPLLMDAGFTRASSIIYTIYSFMCHQLPESSYFFGGASDAFFATYPLATLVAQGADATNELTLRHFHGSPALGYKVALCQREVAMYAGVLAGALLFGGVRHRRPRPMPIWLLVLFALPMVLDGGTHLVSNVTGNGWREANEWALWLTGAALALEWYRGTMVGSLNWLLRTVTGFLFGAGMIWFAISQMDGEFAEVRDEAARHLRKPDAT